MTEVRSLFVSFALGKWKGLVEGAGGSSWLLLPCEEDLGGAAPPAWRSLGAALNRRWVFKPRAFLGPEKLSYCFGAFLMSTGAGSKFTACQVWVWRCKEENICVWEMKASTMGWELVCVVPCRILPVCT